jgi:hypothetical protein
VIIHLVLVTVRPVPFPSVTNEAVEAQGCSGTYTSPRSLHQKEVELGFEPRKCPSSSSYPHPGDLHVSEHTSALVWSHPFTGATSASVPGTSGVERVWWPEVLEDAKPQGDRFSPGRSILRGTGGGHLDFHQKSV